MKVGPEAPAHTYIVIVCLGVSENVEIDVHHPMLGSLRRADCARVHLVLTRCLEQHPSCYFSKTPHS